MQCAGLAAAGALLALAVRRQSGEFAALIAVAVTAAVGILSLELLRPVLEFAEKLRDKAGLDHGVLTPVLKTLAIGLLTQLGKSICEDAGEKAIGSALELSGGVASLCALLPLLQGVLDLLDRIL